MVDFNEEDFDGFHIRSWQIPTDSDHMRQPTNLELATFIALQSNFQTAQQNLIHVDSDIMSDEEDYEIAVKAFNEASRQATIWWVRLLHDPSEFPGILDYEEDD